MQIFPSNPANCLGVRGRVGCVKYWHSRFEMAAVLISAPIRCLFATSRWCPSLGASVFPLASGNEIVMKIKTNIKANVDFNDVDLIEGPSNVGDFFLRQYGVWIIYFLSVPSGCENALSRVGEFTEQKWRSTVPILWRSNFVSQLQWDE